MLILWVMAVVLVAALAVVVVLLKGVLVEARSITPTVSAIAGVANAGSRDLDAVIALVTTQNYISQVVAGLANYGGSLDAALPDA
jgi:anti-sigma-K factor RskA